jgi:hypothetical protein
MMDAAERVLADQARALAEAELYILSPQMCDVVVAAATTLTLDDLTLITADDPPTPSGLLVLPYPLVVRTINGNLGDDRAYQWQSPIPLPRPDPAAADFTPVPSVRVSLFHDSHGPVRPDSFLEFEAAARAQGTPLPPLLLDATRCVPFEPVVTDEQRRNLAEYIALTRQSGEQARNRDRAAGLDEDRVIGEYAPGSEIDDPDDSFATRFLYAFWRLCRQKIAVAEPAEVRHSARVAAQKAGVTPDVRVVQLRSAPTRGDGTPASAGGRDWQHRWPVRIHKVRQWYPSEQRHHIHLRGPYIKGPEDKPLIGGEVVHGMTR